MYPLQVEIHCGGDLGDNVEIYFQHENRLTLKYCGKKLFETLYKNLMKNRWLKNNGYQIYNIDKKTQSQKIYLEFKKDESVKDKKDKKGEQTKNS